MQLDLKLNRAASVRLARAVSHLQQARQHLTAATHAASNRYYENRLRRFALDLRAFSEPVEGLASFLEHGGGR